ncbi:MAG: DNA polymerase I [bacterium]|nr:MAG: DNA polymerase I [bacterium]
MSIGKPRRASSALVTSEQRAQAKTVNFGILYGQGPVGLARQIGITREEAKQFIATYKAQFPGVTEFLDRTVREATSTGYVMTLLKRRRYLPNLASPEGRFRAEAERMAINTPIQGTAADMIKLAMLDVDRELSSRHPEARLLLQVHDELVLEAPAAEATLVAATVREAMERAIELSVPVVVDVGVGRDWASIH